MTGGREIDDWVWIRDQLDWFIDVKMKDKKLSEMIFIYGDADGVDKEVDKYCLEHGICGIPLRTINHIYPVIDEKTLRKDLIRLLYLGRDIQCVENCDLVLALWDGKSTGTKFTMDYARKLNKPVLVRQYGQ